MKVGLIVSSIFFCFLVNEALQSEAYFSQTKKSLQTSIVDGKEIYVDFCMQCHLGSGKGSETVPPLAGSDWLINKRKESIHAVNLVNPDP